MRKSLVLHIAGWIETSLIDVIGDVSFVIWFNYCNFRCPWCQNAHVVHAKITRRVTIDEILDAIERVANIIGYVHVTGGEPTLQAEGLKELLKRCKDEIGVKTSISTNGSRPIVVKDLIENKLLNHIAIDIKAPLRDEKKYKQLTGCQKITSFKNVLNSIRDTIELSLRRVKFVELRTTIIPEMLKRDDVLDIIKDVKDLVSYNKFNNRVVYVLQQFMPSDTMINRAFRELPKTDLKLLYDLAHVTKNKIKDIEIYIRAQEIGILKI